jgi:hypothetical protein
MHFDVYEEEGSLFFTDRSLDDLQDDVFFICIADLPREASGVPKPQRCRRFRRELLLGRRTDALTIFFANVGIVLRHFQN